MSGASTTPRKLSEAQSRRLSCAPDNWKTMPMFGDGRPTGPLKAKGLIEVLSKDVTPADWTMPGVRMVRQKWRITPAGRAHGKGSK